MDLWRNAMKLYRLGWQRRRKVRRRVDDELMWKRGWRWTRRISKEENEDCPLYPSHRQRQLIVLTLFELFRSCISPSSSSMSGSGHLSYVNSPLSMFHDIKHIECISRQLSSTSLAIVSIKFPKTRLFKATFGVIHFIYLRLPNLTHFFLHQIFWRITNQCKCEIIILSTSLLTSYDL